MHQFKFTQQQAQHLSVEEFDHYAELGLIRGVGPHLRDVILHQNAFIRDLEGERDAAQEVLDKAPKECPACGHLLNQ
jgi:hypothetical protein